MYGYSHSNPSDLCFLIYIAIIRPKPLKGILITSVSYSHSFDVSTPANHSYSPSGVRGTSLFPISME